MNYSRGSVVGLQLLREADPLRLDIPDMHIAVIKIGQLGNSFGIEVSMGRRCFLQILEYFRQP